MIRFPAFNEKNTNKVHINNKSDIYKIFNTDAKSFDNYCELFCESGYELKQKSSNEVYSNAAFLKGSLGVFINYFYRTKQLNIVTERECNFFEFSDKQTQSCTTVQLTQLAQEDYGMSYVIRLSDGRFIVIDGGNNFELEVDRLMSYLREHSPHEKPIIASWIMTHAHCDHYQCYIGFDDKYKEDYIIESFMLNFMEIDDERFSGNMSVDARFDFDNSNCANIPILFEKMVNSKAPIYMPHTGQVYNIGDARIEFLSTLDETVDFMNNNINATSLVFKLDIASQTVLFTADATFSEAKLVQLYGDYLKSDILQVPHHGFEGPIDPEVELEGYILTNPEVCLLPVSEYNAYTMIDSFKIGPRFLYEFSNTSEIIVGGKNETLTLPYTPPYYKRAEYKAKFQNGLKNNGSTVWVFDNLHIENEEDVIFNFLNMCNKDATVDVQIYFLSSDKNLADIKIVLPTGLNKINITDKNSIITDSVWFTWMSPDVKGFPTEGEFAIRFISDIPIVISNKNQKPTYKG